ncbi:hypothetical protein PMAYCL1PPCAC_23235 [Pristionchus mayeri]|uniref:Uncharacterized protein n=1 Tax=Pristionchus mayeri TaxID=1317129 RepID=A0AAN5I6E8_9BILA|nr:hypothetical protein PMAYCL1PPCAC_23235 [Pristionchus mayeri]
MGSILERLESGLKETGGQVIEGIAQSAEEKVDQRLDSLTNTLNKDADLLVTELIALSSYLKVAIALFSVLMLILVLKNSCEGVDVMCRMIRRSSSSSSSRGEREPLSI